MNRTVVIFAAVVVGALFLGAVSVSDFNRGRAPAQSKAPAPAAAVAADWTLVPDASRLAFVSVKDGDVAETHAFTGLSGGVDAEGAAQVSISLASVATGIDIRNERMRDLLFRVADFPLAEVRAATDPAAFAGLGTGDRTALDLEIEVDAQGMTAVYYAELSVTRLGEDRVAVATSAPILVDAADFGLTEGVDELRWIAGLDSISTAVPVTFDLVLER